MTHYASIGVTICSAMLALTAASQVTAGPLAFFASANGGGSACTYAAPCSVATARDKAKAATPGQTGNIFVYLLAGYYTPPLLLDASDSGTNGYSVIYSNYQNGAVYFLGGQKVTTTWQLHDAAKNIYKTNVGSFPVGFRQLYVNGTRAIRARQPNLTQTVTSGPYHYADFTPAALDPRDLSVRSFRVLSSDASLVSLNSSAEVVWLSHWRQKRMRIASISAISGVPNKAEVKFKEPENSDAEVVDRFPQTPQTPYYLEGDLAMLDAEGEWFYDQPMGLLYYKPRAGEDVATAHIVMPRTETLLKIEGQPSQLAHHIEILGIQFKYSNWDRPSAVGYLNSQAAVESRAGDDRTTIPGAIVLNNTANIRLVGNTVEATGAHGIVMTGTSQANTIIGNTVRDTSAGGIYDVPANAVNTSNSSHTKIVNNIVSDGGRYYTDAVGILLTSVHHAEVESNTIERMPYSGISLGWNWRGSSTIGTSDNRIQYNRISQVMRLHDDGAGIYTLGNQPNTVIKNNYITTARPSTYAGTWAVAGLYFDDGSQNKTAEANVIDNTAKPIYAKNGTFIDANHTSITNQNNLFINNVFNTQQDVAYDYGATNQQSGNVQVTSWPATALATIAAAGPSENSAVRAGNVVTDYLNSPTRFLAFDDSTDAPGWSAQTTSPAPWIEIDLQTQQRIKRIEVVSKFGPLANDVIAERSDFEIRASNSAAMTQGNYVRLKAVASYDYLSTLSFIVDDPAAYRYVALVKTKSAPFYLNEIRIFRTAPSS